MQDAIDPNTTPGDGAQALQGQPQGPATPGGLSREDLSIGLIALGSVLMLIMIARMLGRRRWTQRAEAHAEAQHEVAARRSPPRRRTTGLIA